MNWILAETEKVGTRHWLPTTQRALFGWQCMRIKQWVHWSSQRVFGYLIRTSSEKWTAFKSGTNRFFVVATDPTLLFGAEFFGVHEYTNNMSVVQIGPFQSTCWMEGIFCCWCFGTWGPNKCYLSPRLVHRRKLILLNKIQTSNLEGLFCILTNPRYTELLHDKKGKKL